MIVADDTCVPRNVPIYVGGKTMQGFGVRFALTALAVLLTSLIIPGIRVDGVLSLLGATLVLALFNAFLRPLLIFFTLPLTILSLGSFVLVINAFLVILVSRLIPGFHVSGFWAAFFGTILISLFSGLFHFLIGRTGRVEVIIHHPSRR